MGQVRVRFPELRLNASPSIGVRSHLSPSLPETAPTPRLRGGATIGFGPFISSGAALHRAMLVHEALAWVA